MALGNPLNGGWKLFHRQSNGSSNGAAPHQLTPPEETETYRFNKIDVVLERYPDEVRVTFSNDKHNHAHDLFSEMLAIAFCQNKLIITDARYPFKEQKTGHIKQAQGQTIAEIFEILKPIAAQIASRLEDTEIDKFLQDRQQEMQRDSVAQKMREEKKHAGEGMSLILSGHKRELAARLGMILTKRRASSPEAILDALEQLSQEQRQNSAWKTR